MLQTIEARWFGQGAEPDDIRDWFDGLPGQPDEQPSRRDFYLQPVDDSGLSVKLREGGLEVKQRRDSHGLVRFGHSVAGLVEQWVKWRFPLDDSSLNIQSILAGDRSWVAVKKQRRLKHFWLAQAGAIQAIPAPSGVSPGGNMLLHVEVARVGSGHGRWWTVGYEAGTEGEDALDRLLAAAGLQLDNAPGRLSEPNSFGYPLWLARYLQDLQAPWPKER